MARSSKRSNAEQMMPVQFTEEHIHLIMAKLPVGPNPRRWALGPEILRDWTKVELPQYQEWEADRSKFPERQRQAEGIAKDAKRFLASLEGLDEQMRAQIADRLARNADLISKEDRLKVRHRFETELEYLRELVATMQQLWAPRRRGRPRNIMMYRVILDLAAIFEYVTETKATRLVDRDTHEECGQFHDFAAAIWPVIFRSVDDGLPAALKKWDEVKGTKYSAVIFDMDLFRHPEWRLFD
jgi:hypothetical protein